MKTSLIIMAAGIGSRFADGIKQLSAVGANGEIIMDYSIHDAIAAGFNKIIIVIRKDIEDDFREIIGRRIEAVCAEHGVELKYVFQELENIPGDIPEGRIKPWGTGQAVLAAKNEIDEPFAVINADDYYGKRTFAEVHNHICTETSDGRYCMAGFVLKNTLSENGGVTRGICNMDGENNLVRITETRNVVKCGNIAKSDELEIDANSVVSMNMWGFDKNFMKKLEEGFADFFSNEVPENPLKSEFLIPVFIQKLLSEEKIKVRVLPTEEKWFGVTYKSDIAGAAEFFGRLTANGVYKKDLYSDL
ncbi:MAG: nucleotidyltransferase [Oscillospiraceae bacterium]|nr:nucleotidyltransferase [Oscillospiraceae bacterium]